MSRNRVRAALAVAALAILLSLTLRWETYRHTVTGEASSCTLSERIDCDRVQASPFASALGVSTSMWGAAGFAILSCWLLQGSFLAAAALAAFSALVSLVMAYISFFEVGAICLYCIGMQACSLALAVLLLPALRATSEGGLLAGLSAATVFGLMLSGEAYAANRAQLASLHAQPPGAKMRIETTGAIVLGDPGARNSVMIFVDFHCPYCRRCYHRATDLQKRFKDRVHFIFKHWPLDKECNDELKGSTHPGSCMSALTGQAAALKGGGQRALAYLFDEDHHFPRHMRELGGEIDVPEAEWEALRKSRRVADLVARDVAEGNALDFNTVPRVYLNGHPILPDRMVQRVTRACERK